MTTINKLLVANRGEIARRVFATCRRLGIGTVAVFSDADAQLAFVSEADVAVRLPGDAAADTYLRTDLILDAARRTGADAVHPGYGFLSESADFARAVIDAGLIWVGPEPASIDAMGSKVAAKELMVSAGVPVLGNLDPATVTGSDLPVLVKASAGGGGRGMRVVRRLDDLAYAVTRAEAEALSAFGDGTVFVEPYVERGRHVEVQVFGEGHATVSVLGDRDCSVQRRHQKVIEEAPAPNLPDELRSELHAAARRAAEAISYRGVGTVEFLVSSDPATGVAERFFFLEMNTRLQVEHPVTECVTGLDLVELQIAAAEGVSVGGTPASAGTSPGLDTLAALAARPPGGHAVEVRLYAEDPSNDWQPQSGRLTRFEIPDVDTELTRPTSYGIRVDSGFRSGDEVGTHYDAMLAKVVAWGPDRRTAVRRLAGVLRRTRLHGITTNRDLLVEILGDRAFVEEELSTDYLAEVDLRALQPGGGPPGTAVQQGLACFAAAVACTDRAVTGRAVQRALPAGWRNVTSTPQVTTFDRDGTTLEVGWYGGRTGYRLADRYGEVGEARATLVRREDGPWRVDVEHDGVTHPHRVFLEGDRVEVESPAGHLTLTRVPRFVDPAEQVTEGSLLAPMPGTVVAVHVAAADSVRAGQPVLTIEAMKMQHTITAPTDGTVSELAVSSGDQVTASAVLAVVSATETETRTDDPSGDDA